MPLAPPVNCKSQLYLEQLTSSNHTFNTVKHQQVLGRIGQVDKNSQSCFNIWLTVHTTTTIKKRKTFLDPYLTSLPTQLACSYLRIFFPEYLVYIFRCNTISSESCDICDMLQISIFGLIIGSDTVTIPSLISKQILDIVRQFHRIGRFISSTLSTVLILR